jgi:hypothetical protein
MSRFPVFVSGIVLGAGVSAAAWYYVANSSASKNAKKPKEVKIVSTTTSPSDSAGMVEEHSARDGEILNETPSYTRLHDDSESDIYPHIDGENPRIDSLRQSGLIVMNNEESVFSDGPGTNIQVRKEVMISVAQLKVIRKGTPAGKENEIDSILNKSNDVKSDAPVVVYDIEFWKSPLNSRGYRMGKRKIALYGIDPSKNIALYQLEEGLFLQTDKSVFRLEPSSEFRSFKAVSDASILKRLGVE